MHDGSRTSTNPNDTAISASSAASLQVAWKYQTLTNETNFTARVIAASGEVVGNTVYIGSWNGYEYAINATTGHAIWQTWLGQTWTNGTTGCLHSPRGISSSATIVNGVVYVGGGYDYWYALNATNGIPLWRVFVGNSTLTGGNYNWASPLIYHGYGYIGVSSDCDKPLVRGQLIQVNLSTHQVIHRFYSVPPAPINGGGGIWTSPTVDPRTNTIFVSTGNINANNTAAVFALDANDVSHELDSWYYITCKISDCDFSTSPFLFHDSTGARYVESGSKDGTVFAFNETNLHNGPVWRTVIANGGDLEKGRGLAASGTFDGQHVLVAGQNLTVSGTTYRGSVWALDPATGHMVWRTFLTQTTFGAVTYENGAVILGTLDLSTYAGILWALNATNGNVLFSGATGTGFYSQATVARSQVFIGSVGGTVYSFAPHTPLQIQSFTASPSTVVLGNGTTFTVVASGGTGPLEYSYTGLPAGCSSVNMSSFLCTPTGTGTFSVTAYVSDAKGATASATTTLTVVQPTEYAVTFTETGLPAGTDWSMTFAGQTENSMTPSIIFEVLNGTYGFTVGPVSGYSASPASGSIMVNGGDSMQSIQFSPIGSGPTIASFQAMPSTISLSASTTFEVSAYGGSGTLTYAYSNLPAGCASADTAMLACTPTGSGAFTVEVQVSDQAGKSAFANASLTVTPAPTYPVDFSESGLPSGTFWSATLAGVTMSGTAPGPIAFSEPNGTYSFTVAPVLGYSANPSQGTVHVAGAGVNEPIGFTAIPAPSVTSFGSSAASITLGESVTFAVTVTGGAAPLTYTYTGLPGGCDSQNVASLTCTPTVTGMFTVTVTVTDAAGKSTSASTSVTVNGASPPPGPTFLGFPQTTGYIVLGLLIAIAIAVVAVLAVLATDRRPKRPTPAPFAPPPGQPPPTPPTVPP